MNKAIKGFPGYKITENGQVISYKNNKMVKLKWRIDRYGYPCVVLLRNGIATSKKVHQLVARAFIKDENDNSLQINHKDGDKLNPHYSNLEWVTYHENLSHAQINKLHSTKINLNIANQIRELYKTGKYLQKELGIIFNISSSNVGLIVRNRIWLNH